MYTNALFYVHINAIVGTCLNPLSPSVIILYIWPKFLFKNENGWSEKK